MPLLDFISSKVPNQQFESASPLSRLDRWVELLQVYPCVGSRKSSVDTRAEPVALLTPSLHLASEFCNVAQLFLLGTAFANTAIFTSTTFSHEACTGVYTNSTLRANPRASSGEK